MQQAIAYRIDPTVKRYIVTTCPRLPDNRVDCEGRNLRSDIGFAKRLRVAAITGRAVHVVPVQPADR